LLQRQASMDAFEGSEKPLGVNSLLAPSLCQRLALQTS
jgi:hypothetical protein